MNREHLMGCPATADPDTLIELDEYAGGWEHRDAYPLGPPHTVRAARERMFAQHRQDLAKPFFRVCHDKMTAGDAAGAARMRDERLGSAWGYARAMGLTVMSTQGNADGSVTTAPVNVPVTPPPEVPPLRIEPMPFITTTSVRADLLAAISSLGGG